MINTILGTKQNMGARFNSQGKRIPLTEIKAEPNVILKLEGGRALLGFGQKKQTKKTEKAFAEVAGFAPRKVKEVKFEGPDNSQKLGDKLTVSVFEPGDLVKVTGITKGRGFTGGVKRWGFAGGPKTHGQSDRHRAVGSIGAGTTPGRVYKGKKMPGHMGDKKQTVINLEVIEVDEKNNLLLVKGAVPGSKNGFVIVNKIGKVKNFVPYKEENKIDAIVQESVEGTQSVQEELPETPPASESLSSAKPITNDEK